MKGVLDRKTGGRQDNLRTVERVDDSRETVRRCIRSKVDIQEITQDQRLMQGVQFVGSRGFVLALCLAGFAAGCGSEGTAPPLEKGAGSAIKAQRKQDAADVKEQRNGTRGAGANPKR